jgi:hypothetical protein
LRRVEAHRIPHHAEAEAAGLSGQLKKRKYLHKSLLRKEKNNESRNGEMGFLEMFTGTSESGRQ